MARLCLSFNAVFHGGRFPLSMASVPLREFPRKGKPGMYFRSQVAASQGLSHVQTIHPAVTCRALTLANAEREPCAGEAGDLSPKRLSQNQRGQKP